MRYTAEHAERCREDFPALQKTHGAFELAYLDGPGGSEVPAAVVEVIADVYATCNVNTHGNFLLPRRRLTRGCRRPARPSPRSSARPSADCISFGQNMTTINYSLSHAIGRTLNAGDGDEVLITALDQ